MLYKRVVKSYYNKLLSERFSEAWRFIRSFCVKFGSFGFSFGVPIVICISLLPMGRHTVPPLVDTPMSFFAISWMAAEATLLFAFIDVLNQVSKVFSFLWLWTFVRLSPPYFTKTFVAQGKGLSWSWFNIIWWPSNGYRVTLPIHLIVKVFEPRNFTNCACTGFCWCCPCLGRGGFHAVILEQRGKLSWGWGILNCI